MIVPATYVPKAFMQCGAKCPVIGISSSTVVRSPRDVNTVLNVRLQGTRTAVYGPPIWGAIGSLPWLGNTAGCVRGGTCDRLRVALIG